MDVLKTRSQLQLNNGDVNVARNLGHAHPVKEAILKKKNHDASHYSSRLIYLNEKTDLKTRLPSYPSAKS